MSTLKRATAYLGFDKALLLHKRSSLSLLLLPLSNTAAQDLDLLHHTGSMPGVACPEGKLLQEDSLRETGARLKARAKVEVQANVGMVPILVVGCILDSQDVKGDHDAIDGYKHRLLLLVYLRPPLMPFAYRTPTAEVLIWQGRTG